MARRLIHRDSWNLNHASRRRDDSDFVAACHKNRGKIQEMSFHAPRFAGSNRAYGRCNDQKAAQITVLPAFSFLRSVTIG